MGSLTGFDLFVNTLGRHEAMRQLRILAKSGAVDTERHPLSCAHLWVETGMAEIWNVSWNGPWKERRWALTDAGRAALSDQPADRTRT